MPRLAKNMTKVVAEAEPVSGGFDLLSPGRYPARLKEVQSKITAKGDPAWNWVFSQITDLEGKKYPGCQFVWTNLPKDGKPSADIQANSRELEKWETAQRLAAGRLHAMFDAFGFDVDSDTDELLGEKVILQIGVEAIKGGPRKGEMQNRVVKVLPWDDDIEVPDVDDDDLDEDEEF